MKLLEGKTALIFGLANKYSIAWGIAQALHEEGAELGFSYAVPRLKKRVMPLAESIDVDFVERCDVTQDDEIDRVFQLAEDRFGKIDVLVHAIAFAEQEDLSGSFVDTSRAGFARALDISAYSLVALTRRAVPLMPDGGSIMTLSYIASQRYVPQYNVMAVAKAALECSARYLAADLGTNGIRVNTISAGPIKTLSAAGVADFRKMLRYVEERTPLRRNVDQGDVGRTAVYLASDLSRAVTGDIIYVDAGYHALGMHEPPENWG
jgi:enoyl-[acyl-carrier protein] reductase I